MRINYVKKALRQGEIQYGCSFTHLGSPEIARMLATVGFHWTYIDSEHGGFGIETVSSICRAAVEWNLCPIVRVADLQYSLIARSLDNGAMGVLFPRVESPELLEKAISWTKYPPVGVRGFGLSATHLEYDTVTIPDVIEHVNENVMVVLQIETRTALERCDELLSVPGIDAVMVGPADLSTSLGVPGNFLHPTMEEAISRIREACVAHGVAPGIQTRTVELARHWKQKGMRFVGCGSEAVFLMNGAIAVIENLRQTGNG